MVLLDSSAWLAHLFGEPGAEQVTLDGLIAATAVVHEVVLVHRDPHFTTIPLELLPQLHLPDKG